MATLRAQCTPGHLARKCLLLLVPKEQTQSSGFPRAGDHTVSGLPTRAGASSRFFSSGPSLCASTSPHRAPGSHLTGGFPVPVGRSGTYSHDPLSLLGRRLGLRPPCRGGCLLCPEKPRSGWAVRRGRGWVCPGARVMGTLRLAGSWGMESH